jgi:SAM-dependent methyltransferase
MPGRDGWDRGEDWYVRAFDETYLRLYAHRDDEEARRLVQTLRERCHLRGPVCDLACGPGRFLRALEEGGDWAVGVDLSPALLRSARCCPGGAEARLIRGDMRSLPLGSSSMAWVLLLFTSFGYFARVEEDRDVLSEIVRVLAPGGMLALDFLNSERLRRELVAESQRAISEGTVREIRWVDPAGPYLRKRVEVAGSGGAGSGTVFEERVRLYAPAELAELLRQVGLELTEQWGDYSGAPFSVEHSARCLLLARKGS